MQNADTKSLEEPIHPGEYLERYVLKAKGISKSQLADKLGVSRQTVSKLINGHANLSSRLALELAAISDEPASFWMKLANDYAIWQRQSDRVAHAGYHQNQHLSDRWSAFGPRVLINREIAEAVAEGFIGIEPFTQEALRPTSYILHLGNELLVDGNLKPIEQGFDLPPRQVVHAITREKLRIPSRVSATLSAKSDLIKKDVFFSLGNIVDPGFHGALFITFENRGSESLRLALNTPVLRIQFHFLAVEPQGLVASTRSDFEEQNGVALDGAGQRGRRIDQMDDETLDDFIDMLQRERARRSR